MSPDESIETVRADAEKLEILRRVTVLCAMDLIYYIQSANMVDCFSFPESSQCEGKNSPSLIYKEQGIIRQRDHESAGHIRI